MDRQNINESLIQYEPETQQNHRLRNTIAYLAFTALSLAGCWPQDNVETPSTVRSGPQTVSNLSPSIPWIEVPKEILLESTTTVPESTTSSTTTTMPPVTTTIPEHPWGDRLYQDNGCDEGNTLNVHVQGENGAAISAQVSADFMIGKQKVDYSGAPIPRYEGYSDFVYINPDAPPSGSYEGVKDVCFENIPQGATVYIETYALARTDSGNLQHTYDSTEQYYGHAMSHQIYPGLGQTVYMNMARNCSESGGTAGSITAQVLNEGTELTIPRIVAWSHSRPSPNVSYGFGVENAEFNNTQQENSLRALAGDQKYLLQVQTTTGDVIIVPEVYVAPCLDSFVQISVDGAGCMAKLAEAILECRLNDELIG